MPLLGNIHSAAGPALGYLYQGYYALARLMECADDEDGVSIETWDDVVIHSGDKKNAASA